jgi:uncharacterized protein
VPSTGAEIVFVPDSLRQHLKQAGIGLDVMQTGAAARTYNILMAENRKVAAALIAVPPVCITSRPIPACFRCWRRESGTNTISAPVPSSRRTGAAARTYNILMAENRKVAAALIAVP